MPENEKLDETPETPAPESGEAKADGSPATAEPGTDYSGIIGGVFIWLLILGAVTYWFFPHNRAQVFLQTSAQTHVNSAELCCSKGHR